MRKIKAIFTILFFMFCSCLGFCQNTAGEEKTKIVQGNVSSMDWVADKLVVRTMDFGTSDEITINVSDDTDITKGTASVSFNDINLSDKITVEYFRNSFAGLKAVHITIQP